MNDKDRVGKHFCYLLITSITLFTNLNDQSVICILQLVEDDLNAALEEASAVSNMTRKCFISCLPEYICKLFSAFSNRLLENCPTFTTMLLHAFHHGQSNICPLLLSICLKEMFVRIMIHVKPKIERNYTRILNAVFFLSSYFVME